LWISYRLSSAGSVGSRVKVSILAIYRSGGHFALT
jgi:hypothetical protein